MATPPPGSETVHHQNKPLVNKPVFVEIIRAKDVVKADVLSESDPYVKISVRKTASPTSELIPDSCEYKSFTVDDEPCPYFGVTVFIAKTALPGSFFHLRLFDEDTTNDDLLGEIAVPVEKIVLDRVVTLTLPFQGKKDKPQEVHLRFRELPTILKKTCAIIRHGESEWNEAQSNMNVKTMISRVDHPLTNSGAAQALTLAAKVKEAAEKLAKPDGVPMDHRVKEFLTTKIIYVSPLCRAVQTALLALHPIGKTPVWFLRRLAREKRNAGGRDSSGTTFGDNLLPFYVKELMELHDNYVKASAAAYAQQQQKEFSAVVGGQIEADLTVKPKATFPFPEELAQMLERFDRTETETKWWQDDREGKDDAARRISDFFFNQLFWDSYEHSIIVGHSHYFRDLIATYMSDSLREKNQE